VHCASQLSPICLAVSLVLGLLGCARFDHSPQALAKAALARHVPTTLATEKKHVVAYPGESTEQVRGQSPDSLNSDGYARGPMLPSTGSRLAQQPLYPPAPAGTSVYGQSPNTPVFAQPPVAAAPVNSTPYGTPNLPPPPGVYGNGYAAPPANPQLPGFPSQGQPYPAPYDTSAFPGFPDVAPPVLQDRPPPPPNVTPLDIYLAETRTGRFMFGVTVNSDAGLGGQITIDERNFDITNPPRSWDDFLNGTAWRGRGQGFQIQAQPGNRVQRYSISFTEPNLFDTDITFSASAFYFQRNYFDYYEERVGGRLAYGYRLTPNLSSSLALRAEDVKLTDPRVAGVAKLDEALGSTDYYSARLNLVHDTRDHPYVSTEGHYLELALEQGFGEFSYPRAEIDYRRFFNVRERPDGSGRHTVALNWRLGFSGDDTPIFENYFAGGYASLRGFSFRGASPIDNTVRTGGNFRFLGSVEYFFPLTADDMIKGTLFCDYGTVQNGVKLDDFRVAPGFGFLLNIPALGPAPLAINFAFPVTSADTDQKQMFSFFFGATR
jgi:outer membrane protein insertion porin family